MDHKRPSSKTGAATRPKDRAAFETLFVVQGHEFYRTIRLFLLGRRLPWSVVDDLTQEVLLRAWAARDNYQRTASLKTWLLAIARNVASEWRGKRPTPLPLEEEVSGGDTVATMVDGREQRRAVRDAIEKLPPKQQQAIRLVYVQGLKPGEAATGINCNHRAFHQRLVEGRNQLRLLLARRRDGLDD